MSQRPNVILILTDQQRGDCLGVDPYAPACLQTPMMDSLAARGTLFRRAYSECPTCMPARRTIFSGLAPAAQGMVGMTNLDFEPPAKLAQLMTDAGYQTESIGKIHLGPNHARWGFEHKVHSEATRGDYGCRYTEFLIRNGYHTPRPGVAHGYDSNGYAGRPNNLPEELTHTSWCIAESLDFLEHRDLTCPFFLNIGFIDPHPPMTPPKAFYDRYMHAPDLPAPSIGKWAEPDKPERIARAANDTRIDLSPETRKHMLAGYYGLIDHVDAAIGRLMLYLSDRKILKNTMIVFSSDHGEMLGDHYRFGKARAYEGSARVPLIIKPPSAWKLSRTQCDTPVGLQDIMPTILDAAGIDVPEHCTGKSLLPIVCGQSNGVRDFIHGEHTDQYFYNEGMHYLTDGKQKYIWYSGTGVEQLFDLQNDPHECDNLAGNAKSKTDIETWRSRLIEIVCDRPECFTDGNKLIAGRPHEKILSTYKPGVAQPFL